MRLQGLIIISIIIPESRCEEAWRIYLNWVEINAKAFLTEVGKAFLLDLQLKT